MDLSPTHTRVRLFIQVATQTQTKDMFGNSNPSLRIGIDHQILINFDSLYV